MHAARTLIPRILGVALAWAALVPNPAGAQPAPAGPATGPAAPPAPPSRSAPPVKNAGQRMMVDRVTAVINDAIILDSELRGRLTPMLGDLESITDPKERQRRKQKLSTQLLDELINEELIVQAAAEAQIEIEAAEVTAAMDQIKSQNNLDDATFTQALAEQGYSMAAYRQDLRRQLIRLRAVNQLVRPKVNITDDDLRARYAEMERRAASVGAVRLAHILFLVPENPTEQQLTAAREKAQATVAQLRAGAVFADVAAQTSEDAGTRETGGELGWFELGTLSPEWESVVFSMDKGEVRGPIAGPQGLHVFTALEVKRTAVDPFDKVKEQIRGEMTRREMDKLTTEWLTELRAKAFVDIK